MLSFSLHFFGGGGSNAIFGGQTILWTSGRFCKEHKTHSSKEIRNNSFRDRDELRELGRRCT